MARAAVFLLCFLILNFPESALAEWENRSTGIKETYANVVVVDPNDSRNIYSATDYFLYASKDTGKSWQEVFAVGGKSDVINYAAISSDKEPVIFVAATNGLYMAAAAKPNIYKRVYSGSSQQENTVNCVALDEKNPDSVYIATGKGAFASQDKAKRWESISTGLGSLSINCIAVEPGAKAIYISSAARIFKSLDNGATWKNVYTMLKTDTAEGDAEEESAEENEEAFGKINCLLINPKNYSEIYAATSNGVLVSKDKAGQWSFMTNLGLDGSQIKYIAISGDGKNIYAAAYKGVFVFDEQQARWVELYKGFTFKDTRFLSIDNRIGVVWAATANGVFMAQEEASAFSSRPQMAMPDAIKDGFNHEPTIAEVQKAAIKYAEVHPSKIQNWRNQARMKAFLPSIALTYDKNVSVSTSTNSFTVGPKDWGVGFSWDVGDLIFSTDQTSIDVRSRLMVELRDDILDDVTRLYYERRRLQVDMAMSAPKTDKEKYDKLLRLEELTA